ncbi:3-hydroxyacyl-CoA dehydrogenase NAD-binding domain-containing protein [Terrarubrum flagellatum]|uniref:3-hydroxyacyl-CoA dehydrogenase NAD-binding domain-containing protein n=1 Tax=Terrirubrum flagellatum TaxID=2895980 RepID=UPI003144F21F
MTDLSPIRIEPRGRVALILIDNPPVNATSHAVRAGLQGAVAQVIADGAFDAAVIAGAGSTFVAGADIREFNKPPQPPHLPDLLFEIEESPKPIVAAIHGSALGGGCEIAIACHGRAMNPKAVIGLPEVKLGLIPGAGGTQRLPRLIGMEAALDIVTSARFVKASEALKLGLVDVVAEDGDHVAAAIALAQKLVGSPSWRSGQLAVPAWDKDSFEKQATAIVKKARGKRAEGKAIEALRLAPATDIRAGMAAERAIFQELRVSPQSAALRHLFFAEREAARVPGVDVKQARPLASVGVIGAGTMGAGIAIACGDAGLSVTVIETTDDALAKGRARIEQTYERMAKSGRIDEAEKTARMARYRFSTDLASLAQADLIIEAVFEDMAVKQELFGRIDKIAKPGAALATNTSYLDPNIIADATSRPQDVIGLHFFSPANIMKLLEIVRPARTVPDVVATGLSLARKLGKLPVVCGVCDGFIGNRILATYRKQIDYMLEDGALPHEIDAAMEEYGLAMGPVAVSDLAGLDIGWARRKRLAPTRDPRDRYVAIADRICELGRFGQKTGRGFYIYENGQRRVDPEITAIIEEESAKKGIVRRKLEADEIVARVRAAIVNEAAKILDEGIAQRSGDIDLVMVNGYGFPAWRGGPLHEADAIGLDRILATARETFARDGFGWEPAPLLEKLAAEGRTFASLSVD